MDKHVQILSDWYAEIRAYCQEYDAKRPCLREPLTVVNDRMAYDKRAVPSVIGEVGIGSYSVYIFPADIRSPVAIVTFYRGGEVLYGC